MYNKKLAFTNKIFIYFFIIFATSFFSYSKWNATIAGWCSYFIFGYLAFFYVKNKNIINQIKSPISKWIKFFIIIPILCFITKIIIYGDSPLEEKRLVFSLLTFLFFYYFYIKRVSEKNLMQIFTHIGLFIFTIQIIQQLFPGTAVFGIKDSETNVANDIITEVRNGLYRYRISGIFFTLVCLFYYWEKICLTIKIKDTILLIIFLTSMYLFLTRQVMFSTLITLILSTFFITNRKKRISILTITTIFMIIIMVYSNSLFGELISKTQEQATNENIRVVAISFYWEKITNNPLSFLFGNGHPKEFNNWQENYGLFSSDIGFIGEMYHYGLFWIAFYFYVVYFLLIKHKNRLPLYIKLFLFSTFINSIMIFPYRNVYEYFVWTSIMYICSLYINKSKIEYNNRLTYYNKIKSFTIYKKR